MALIGVDALADLDPATYTNHSLHDPQRVWPETNCYLDVWIELLHALQLEPLACCGVALACDFEGDQWTFIKPRPGELEALYGIGVEELSVWRSVLDHAETTLELGQLPLIEVDSFYLPDTQGTSYRSEHVKTTAVIASLDRSAARMHYFHGPGAAELSGEDFEGLFAAANPLAPGLPPFCERVRIGQRVARDPEELRAIARELDRAHFARVPRDDPFRRHAARFDEHLAFLLESEMELYHGYVFTGLRQCGAAFALAAEHFRWLGPDDARLADAANELDSISSGCKALLFKVARWVHARRAGDGGPALLEMGDAWSRAMGSLKDALQI